MFQIMGVKGDLRILPHRRREFFEKIGLLSCFLLDLEVRLNDSEILYFIFNCYYLLLGERTRPKGIPNKLTAHLVTFCFCGYFLLELALCLSPIGHHQ